MKAKPNNKDIGLTNWATSFELVPGAITASDLDGICEKRGQFLAIESKYDNEPIGRGQEIMLEQLSLVPVFTVFIVYMKDKSNGKVHAYQRVKDREVLAKVPCADKQWETIVARWVKWATSSPVK